MKKIIEKVALYAASVMMGLRLRILHKRLIARNDPDGGPDAGSFVPSPAPISPPSLVAASGFSSARGRAFYGWTTR